MDYQLISSDTELKIRCEAAAQANYVALDTEFVRTRTYYPGLGLIQLYDGQQLSLIDPLTITDWQPFCDLLANTAVTKLLHACSEDLEVFLHEFNLLPTPMIDTQILAAFIGYSLSSGFASQVAEKLQVTLDKSETRTDWLARPLSSKQCSYAAADVYYLLPLAEKIIAETKEKGWMAAAQDECRSVCLRRRNAAIDPELAYLDINNASQLQGRQLATLKALAAWRLRYARERDIALNFVVREEHLWQIARFQPSSLAELGELGLSGPEIRYHGNTLLAQVKMSQQLADDQLPPPIFRLIEHPGYKSAFKILKTQLQELADAKGLNSELLSSRRQINQLLTWHWGACDELPILLSGWRGELFAESIKTLLEQIEK